MSGHTREKGARQAAAEKSKRKRKERERAGRGALGQRAGVCRDIPERKARGRRQQRKARDKVLKERERAGREGGGRWGNERGYVGTYPRERREAGGSREKQEKKF